MNVAFITTVGHNIGDDFVREGLEHLLTRALGRRPNFTRTHKHRPATARLGFAAVRSERLNRLLDRLPVLPIGDRILGADCVVQSGAPVYWCHPGISHCADNEWFGPLVRRRLRQSVRRMFLNLAAGSCQRYHDVTGLLCERCSEYVRELHGLSRLTTVRDDVARRALGRLGLEAEVIACSSLFGPDNRRLQSEGAEYVAANYMPRGGHYTFGQAIDEDRWRRTFTRVYRDLKRRERVILVCHDAAEVAAAREIDPDGELFTANDDAVGAMRFYARAKYGLMNRVHGAMMLAAFGKPSVVVGTDTRAQMVDVLGLQRFFVEEASTDSVLAALRDIAATLPETRDRLLTVKHKAEQHYLSALQCIAESH